jgi:DNA-directed RNA polymerase specialized sigma24 family protein
MTGLFGSLEAMVPALRRYAAAMLADQGKADEVVQACVADAIGRLRTPLDGAELRVRLFGAVYRQLTARSRFQRPHGPSRWARTPDSPLTSTELTGALSRLPLEQRSVIFLISVEDLSYAAVAEVMTMPIAAIMSLLGRAREQLRQSVGSGAFASPQRVS